MGYTREILAQKKLDDKSVFYTDKFVIEIAESVHMHFRNFRLDLCLKEWKILAKGFIISYLRWWFKGKPGYQPPIHNWKMFKSKVDPVAGKGGKSIIENELRVELSQFADYVHLHFRNTRYEFTIDEFLEYADEITQARDNIRNMDILKDYPKRIGFHHVQQPKGKVTYSENIGEFVTHSDRFPDSDSKTFDSVILNRETGRWEKQIEYQDNPKPVSHESGIVKKIIIKIGKKSLHMLDSVFGFF